MIVSKQIKLKKELPFNATLIESEFVKMGIDVLRWAVVEVTDNEFVIDATVIEN